MSRQIGSKKAIEVTNRLSKETSPYLLQHSENPVDWFPWGQGALDLAQEMDKPILLSVGYAACHWCHVMAHESFEDPETAALMNNYFINIKVDSNLYERSCGYDRARRMADDSCAYTRR